MIINLAEDLKYFQMETDMKDILSTASKKAWEFIIGAMEKFMMVNGARESNTVMGCGREIAGTLI